MTVSGPAASATWDHLPGTCGRSKNGRETRSGGPGTLPPGFWECETAPLKPPAIVHSRANPSVRIWRRNSSLRLPGAAWALTHHQAPDKPAGGSKAPRPSF